jgi:lysozyme family protein
MAKTSYEVALTRLLADEGGYCNDAADPGGPTRYGVTLADARLHWKSNATARDVQTMPIEIAKGIYRAKYWDAQRCDDLPAGVDYAIFDYGVNSGIGRSGKVLRRKLGMSDSISTVTNDVVAMAGRVGPEKLAAAICDERLGFLKSLKTWPVFGRGWGRRVAGVRAAALGMAVGASATLPPSVVATAGKGMVPKPKAAQTAIVVATTSASAAGGAGASSTAMAILIVLVVLAVGIGAVLLVNHLRNVKQEAAVKEPVGA